MTDMPEKSLVSISVHEFVDLITPGGDLVFSGASPGRMAEGIRAHRRIQQEDGILTEIPVSFEVEGQYCVLRILGRIDVMRQTAAATVIEEIKSTYSDLSGIEKPHLAHFLQAKCYAAIYSLSNETEAVIARITYVHLPDHEIKAFSDELDRNELIEWFSGCCRAILSRMDAEQARIHERNLTIRNAGFPFSDYRRRQKKMAAEIYYCCRDRSLFFIQAPTGIGKTIAALFPAAKAVADGLGDKIFYLTAASTLQPVAENTLRLMRSAGIKIKSVTITAKEKICPTPGVPCHPSFCPLAAGYYERLPLATQESELNIHLGADEVKSLAEKHSLCPFELSLDLALSSDVIICDYNYVFDPRVQLRRFFEDGGEYILLVDEAHNLVSRAREMYSFELSKEDVMALRRKLPKKSKSGPVLKLHNASSNLNRCFINLRKMLEQENVNPLVRQSPDQELYEAALKMASAAEPYIDVRMPHEFSAELMELYFSCRNFVKACDEFDEKCSYIVKRQGTDLNAAVFCMDPSTRLDRCYKRARCAAFFSASLTPFEYFIRALSAGGNTDSAALPSPFDVRNLCILVNNTLSTKYNDRTNTAWGVAESIYEFTSARKGNYMVFFPSYAYMQMIHDLFVSAHPEILSPMQQKGMDNDRRAEFMDMFREDAEQTMAAFVVMGGVFGEGIDLAGGRLIGAVIVGVGLPQISVENDLIREYYTCNEEPGFAYAYLYPGFNRVLQAVGRIIRKSDDRGAALLIDPRFTRNEYRRLMPPWWEPVKFVKSPRDIKKELTEFWGCG